MTASAKKRYSGECSVRRYGVSVDLKVKPISTDYKDLSIVDRLI
jgi:hypothetical protein